MRKIAGIKTAFGEIPIMVHDATHRPIDLRKMGRCTYLAPGPVFKVGHGVVVQADHPDGFVVADDNGERHIVRFFFTGGPVPEDSDG